MNKKILLSIIIPVYNVEKYLEECLKSVYSLKLESKEVIIVIDGSKDESYKIAEEFYKYHKNETKIIYQENKGLSEARNIGLKEANGEYVYFLDSDDFIDPQNFERFFLNIINTNYDIIHGNAYIYPNGKESYRKEYLGKIKEFKGKDFLYTTYEKQIYKEAVWLNIYRRNYLIKNNLFFQKNIIYEDTLFSFKAFFEADSIKILDIYFYYYRQREESIMNKKRDYMTYLYIWDRLLSYIQENNIASRRITTYFISLVRSFAKQEKVFSDEVYFKLWNLKKKDLTSFRNLIDLKLKSYFLKKIKYEDIKNVGNKNEKSKL